VHWTAPTSPHQEYTLETENPALGAVLTKRADRFQFNGIHDAMPSPLI
jgi:hypothetical protein